MGMDQEKLEGPGEALGRLMPRLSAVSTETVGVLEAAGRVLAEDVVTDRESPPCDVSAMDGYAMRLGDAVTGKALEVSAEARMGEAPPSLTEGTAVKVSTGAAVPAEAELVIQREQVEESADRIVIGEMSKPVKRSLNIRRRGENAGAGAAVLSQGVLVEAAGLAGLVSFGLTEVSVYRRVKVAVLVSGDELKKPGEAIEAWQIRDSNGPMVDAFLRGHPFVEVVAARHVGDDLDETSRVLGGLMDEADVVVTTGGVSMGDRDFLPSAAAAVGAETVYHKLAMRPGKPNYAAVTGAGKVMMGLPGNPVSVLCGLVRLVRPVLRHLAGFEEALPTCPVVKVTNADDRALHLWWYRLATLSDEGAALLGNKGSGDVAALARAQGFLEVEPGEALGAGARYWGV